MQATGPLYCKLRSGDSSQESKGVGIITGGFHVLGIINSRPVFKAIDNARIVSADNSGEPTVKKIIIYSAFEQSSEQFNQKINNSLTRGPCFTRTCP